MELRGTSGEALMEESAARASEFQAIRCLFVAMGLLQSDRAAESEALLERARKRVQEARSRHEDLPSQVPGASAWLQWVQGQADELLPIARAEAHLSLVRAREGVERNIGGLGLGDADQGAGFLVDNFGEWRSFAGSLAGQPGSEGYQPPRIAPRVPALRTVAVKPMFLDTVLNALGYPNVDHRVKKAQGMLGGLNKLMSFGWGRS